MKIVSDLYKNVKNTSFYRKQFTETLGNKNVLFLDPIMTTFDWYTCLIPYNALEETDHVSTAITGLYRFSELDDKPQTILTNMEILWADVIVVPFTLEKFYGDGELFDLIKKVNSNIKIIFTVEFDFYDLRKDHFLLMEHPEKKDEIIERLEKNCKGADRILVLNEKLKEKLQLKGFESVKTLPVFYAEDVLKENIDFQDSLGIKHTPKIFNLSCDLNEYNYDSFKEYIPVLKKIQEKYKRNFKLIVIGDDPKKYYPKINIEYTHLKKGSIVHKYKNIFKSTADCHLVLNKKTEYYINSEMISDYVERGVFSIPIISMKTYPYNQKIVNGENGFLLNARKDLIKIVDSNINDKISLQEICSNIREDLSVNHEVIKKDINDNYKPDIAKLTQIEEIFLKNYPDDAELD